LRLLVVDDDEPLRALLRTTFEAVDVEVDEAYDAQTARLRIDADPPDAIVLDVSMPGLDGAAFCATLKASSATRHIPVVLLTGSDLATEATAVEVGADAFMLKPFSPLELLAVVERLAGGLYGSPFRAHGKRHEDEQLLLYARDLRHLLEIERGQRVLHNGALDVTGRNDDLVRDLAPAVLPNLAFAQADIRQEDRRADRQADRRPDYGGHGR